MVVSFFAPGLLHRIAACIHTSRESSLEGIHLLVVSGLRCIGLLLYLRTCRLSRLLLGLLVRLTLFPSAAHRTDGRSDRRAGAGISRDRSDRCTSDSTSRGSLRSSSLSLRRVLGSLLLCSLYVCFGWTCGRSGVWIYSGLLLHLGVAVILVSDLLVLALIVPAVREHPELLRRRKRRWRPNRSSRGGSWGRNGCRRLGIAGFRFLAAFA